MNGKNTTTEIIEKNDELTDIQKDIINLIKKNNMITQAEIASTLGINREKVKYNIMILKNKNIILREGSTKKSSYKIL